MLLPWKLPAVTKMTRISTQGTVSLQVHKQQMRSRTACAYGKDLTLRGGLMGRCTLFSYVSVWYSSDQ